MRVALAQLNPTVGSIRANADCLREAAALAAGRGADLLVGPEQVLAGYPAEDLLLRAAFLSDVADELARLGRELPLPTLIGFPEHEAGEAPVVGGAVGSFAPSVGLAGRTWNAAALAGAGAEPAAVVRKELLPNYGVFDEARYFAAGTGGAVIDVGGVAVGVTICEDIWHEQGPHLRCAQAGANVVVNLSASPFSIGRPARRRELVRARARELDMPVLLANLVGGQDDLVFDGTSVVALPDGTWVEAPSFVDGVLIVDLDLASGAATISRAEFHLFDGAAARPVPLSTPAPQDRAADTWAALKLAVRDYLGKNHMEHAYVGLSGGIDSAVVAALASDALGPDRVVGVTMPSLHNSAETQADAQELARRLGVTLHELPIDEPYTTLLRLLKPVAGDDDLGVMAENLQSRLRGVLLMALANRFGGIVLTTGNKSEVSVGYMTLYGDMAGGFAPLKDVPKTQVWELARWRNEEAVRRDQVPPIPESTIERPPSAELRPDQKDTDSLLPYDELDAILALYVDEDASAATMVAAGFDHATVERVIALVDAAEHKRRQAAPGPRVSLKAFGRDRRLPITNGYR